MGGKAPCLDSYVGVWETADVGFDPHAVHGIEAKDGGIISVGMALEKEGSTSLDGFVIKTQGSCTFDSKYTIMTPTGTGCSGKWEWVTKIGTSGKMDQSLWAAQSNDGTFIIVAGMKDNGSGKSTMVITKLLESDGSVVWTMNYGTGAGVETVAFTSDGGFVVGGYIDMTDDLSEIAFKSGGQVTSGKPFLGKISAANAAASSAPSAFEWTYSNDSADYAGSAKAIRIDSSDNIYSVFG